MFVWNVNDYINKFAKYCENTEYLYRAYIENEIESKVISCLNSKTVPIIKLHNLNTNNEAVNYIPSIEYDDTSFPLDLLFKEQLERVFDTDLSMVRIHTGEYSHELASKQGAKAVTMGNSIFFARGMYSPYTEEGLSLLAHEVEHVVQYNDKDQSFLYDEDIILAEYMAESVERQVKNIKLHNVNSGVFNKGVNVERDNPEDITNETTTEIGEDSSIDDFSSQDNEIRYNITFENGKIYNLSQDERGLVIEQAAEKVNDYIENKLTMLSDLEADKYLLKVLKYVQRRS